jgi:hypothetical protein
MKPIADTRVQKDDGKFIATCICGKTNKYSSKHRALKMLNTGRCISCRPDYRSANDRVDNIYRRDDGKWCSKCESCQSEQAYTRKDHARSSSRKGWKCKKCVSLEKSFSANQPIGCKARTYRRFKSSAISRGLSWGINEEEMFQDYNGICCMTGMHISLEYKEQTASLDRIDNSKGYEVGNIQWVHKEINMMRGPLSIDRFTELCEFVSSRKLNGNNNFL